MGSRRGDCIIREQLTKNGASGKKHTSLGKAQSDVDRPESLHEGAARYWDSSEGLARSDSFVQGHSPCHTALCGGILQLSVLFI